MNLVKKLQARNEEAYQELVETYTTTFTYLASQYIKNREDVKDCVQEIFLKVYQNIHKFHDTEVCFKPWVITLAKNQVIDVYRRLERNRERIIYDDDIINNARDYSTNSVSNIYLEELQEFIGNENYELLVYHLVTKMTFVELAILFDEPKYTIRRRYLEAYERSQAFIAAHGKEFSYVQ